LVANTERLGSLTGYKVRRGQGQANTDMPAGLGFPATTALCAPGAALTIALYKGTEAIVIIIIIKYVQPPS
jgi:hypothetical protein